jgi:hypothetical protein
MDFMIKEKERMDREGRALGIEPCNLAAFAPKRITSAPPLQTSLAQSLASGELSSSGIGKLTLLGNKKAAKKKASVVAKAPQKTKLEMIHEGVERSQRKSRGIGDSIGQAIGLAVGAMKSGPAAKTAAAVMAAAGANTKAITTKQAAAPATPRTDNTSSENHATNHSTMNPTIKPASDRKEDIGNINGKLNEDQGTNNKMEEAEPIARISSIEEILPKWEDVERAAQQKEGYQVRYEYTENLTDPQRSTATELYDLAEELWRADPDLEIYSLDEDLNPIKVIEVFH